MSELPHLDRRINEAMAGLAPIEDKDFREQQQAQVLLDFVEEGISFLQDQLNAVTRRADAFVDIVKDLEEVTKDDSVLAKEFKQKEKLLAIVKDRCFIVMKALKSQIHVRKGTHPGEGFLTTEGPAG